jgi:hypothetical protein
MTAKLLRLQKTTNRQTTDKKKKIFHQGDIIRDYVSLKIGKVNELTS